VRVALVNPNWSFDGSIYFGCREPHLPSEYGYTKALLIGAGHSTEIFDAHAEGIEAAALADRVAEFAPDMTVVTTAPSYLFWRCAPPELRVPQQTLGALGDVAGTTIIVGPHGSATPRAVLGAPPGYRLLRPLLSSRGFWIVIELRGGEQGVVEGVTRYVP
jgi:anaerobic magnesium-protoporphyrin IX monomethyl ester cyclase